MHGIKSRCCGWLRGEHRYGARYHGAMSSKSFSQSQTVQNLEPQIAVLKLHPAAQLPRYAHLGPFGDLGADLHAVESATIAPGATAAIPTGIALGLPAGFGALVEDRSGLALRGLTTLAGVIDPGYRGEIKVVLTNLGGTAATIAPGDRIAQLRIVRRLEATFTEVSSLDRTPRDGGGFGSTGT